MSSGEHASTVRLVGCSLVERSLVCDDGGGFETELWSIRVNDGWVRTGYLQRRGAIGGVTTELLDEDDPSGILKQRWQERPPQVYFQRRIRIVAPIGTRLWQRVWRPVIEHGKSWSDYLRSGELSVAQRRFDRYFELLGEDRIVSERALEAKRQRGPAPAAGRELSKEETRQQLDALLARLGGGAPTPPARRRPAVRSNELAQADMAALVRRRMA